MERLKRRAARGNREEFLAVLDNVPDVEPAPEDRILDMNGIPRPTGRHRDESRRGTHARALQCDLDHDLGESLRIVGPSLKRITRFLESDGARDDLLDRKSALLQHFNNGPKLVQCIARAEDVEFL